MKHNAIYENLEQQFALFQEEFAQARRDRLPHIEYLLSQAKLINSYAYLSEKCTGLLGCCKDMARLRQPTSYDESETVCFALADLNGIRYVLVEGGFGHEST